MKLNKIKKGDKLSMTYYLDVISTTSDGINVQDQNGVKFLIKGAELIEKTIQSASQFDKTEKVSRTIMVEKLLNAKDTVFTAVFDKVSGEERSLVGHLIDADNHMGRSNVIDLEATGNNVLRQVDHRSLKELIINNTKYIVK